jgi:Cft2 family RNA processing exonuclease
MSTFDGLIREFPTVAIDNFRVRPGVKVYLLSHVHSDHLTGLAAEAWDSPIYCSPITAQWLPMLATRSKQLAFESGRDRVLCRKYAHLAPFMVRSLPLSRKKEIQILIVEGVVYL